MPVTQRHGLPRRKPPPPCPRRSSSEVRWAPAEGSGGHSAANLPEIPASARPGRADSTRGRELPITTSGGAQGRAFPRMAQAQGRSNSRDIPAGSSRFCNARLTHHETGFELSEEARGARYSVHSSGPADQDGQTMTRRGIHVRRAHEVTLNGTGRRIGAGLKAAGPSTSHRLSAHRAYHRHGVLQP